jgi:protein-tyrosine phosphatase
MIKRVLVVCVGNICRSPIAEFVFRHRLANDRITVESAGLAALVGNPVDPLAEAVLAEHGLTAASHIARQVSPALIDAADIVLVMDKRHVSAIHAQAPHARGKTFLLGRWQGDRAVPDPYGKPKAEFSRTYDMVGEAVDSWVTRF